MGMTFLILLCDNIIAGIFIGPDGVAAINTVSPLIGVVSFVSICVSVGVSILYTRAIGEMRRDRADELYGMGVMVSGVLAVCSLFILLAIKEPYFISTGAVGDILVLSRDFYSFLPINSAVFIIASFMEEMVYADGDEFLVPFSHVARIAGKILLSILFVNTMGIKGIMLGTLLGNVFAFISLLMHYFRKSNTLHFVFFFDWHSLYECIKYSITDGITYLLLGLSDYCLIAYISRRFGTEYLVILAVAVSVIGLAVVFDGIGMAIQPLLGVYYGEKNHLLISRLMKDAITTAVVEGVVVSILLYLFAGPFVRLFGIDDTALSGPAVTAVRIMSVTLVASSLFMLMTSYYLYMDRVRISVGAIILKDGILSILLPILFSAVLGINGIWLGFAFAPVMGLLISVMVIRVRNGKKGLTAMTDSMESEITVYDTVLTPDNMTDASEHIQERLKEKGYSNDAAMKAGLFAEEISATIREKNGDKKVLVEYSLLFDKDTSGEDGTEKESVRLVIRDSGIVFDVTDPELKISGLSSFVINGLMNAQKDKDYIPTTGYNRNVIRLYK